MRQHALRIGWWWAVMVGEYHHQATSTTPLITSCQSSPNTKQTNCSFAFH
jgi:hypothetical protein